MKKFIPMIWFLVLMSLYTNAQNSEGIMKDTVKNTLIEQEYIVQLLQKADVVFCTIEDVDDFVYIKRMMVMFNSDSSIFRSALIESNYYTTISTIFYPIICTTVFLDDVYGNTQVFAYQVPFTDKKLDEEPLNDYPLLIPVLDSLIQYTDTCSISDDTRVFLNLDWD
jgi:hypothetical protein